jgi:hypothetical protein
MLKCLQSTLFYIFMGGGGGGSYSVKQIYSIIITWTTVYISFDKSNLVTKSTIMYCITVEK